jgi:hypothetical protein
VLRTDGALILIEGRWHTWAGLTAAGAEAAVRRRRAEARVTMLTDPDLWGGPITDERPGENLSAARPDAGRHSAIACR